MNEQKVLKKQFMIHILYNMIAFSLIFSAFGLFMVYMIKTITFSAVDKKLIEAEQEYNDTISDTEILYKMFNLDNYLFMTDNENSRMPLFSEFGDFRKISNPQINVIVRDSIGKVLNESNIGRINDYIDQISFDSHNLNNIYNMKINNEYNYRCFNFKNENIDLDDDANSDEYIQLLINVDSEINLINSYKEIIIYAVVVGIFLSAVASIVLSKKTLKPIEKTLKNQTEFVQNASHELRTPLTIIQAKQELLLQEPNAKIIDKSEDIMLTLNETKRLSKLTKDLMLLVREDDMKLQKEDINIDEFIENIILPYKDIAEASGKKLELNLNFGKDASVDPNRIHQLLVILLDNAIKYTEVGDKIELRTILKDNKCIIEVLDTGIGISDEGIGRIFDRFYREDGARNRETGGSGLGLSIANNIVKAHNGTIKVSHNNPKGTIFTIRLNR